MMRRKAALALSLVSLSSVALARKARGLTVPQSLLLRADQVIQ
jgi:hypothetical protein